MRQTLLCLSALLAVGIAACGTRETRPASPAGQPVTRDEAALRERVMEWWAAREERIQRTMLELYEPSYRERVGLMEFSIEGTTRDRFDLVDARIREITFEGPERASVQVDFKILTPQFGEPIPSGVRENWVKVKGQWYKVHVKPSRPPMPIPPTASPSPPALPTPDSP